MKTLPFLRTLATAVLLGGAPATSLAQGPLNPPGPPAPMMKTLVEMEPRTHIVSLPYTITASGSYYLTASLSGGGSSAGIVIQTSGVTIDLRGFSIENCTSGISASGMGIKDVAIHNGGVRGCTGSGIDLGGVEKVRLENVMVSDNGGDGASVGEASLVTLCTAKGNTANGITLGSGGKVFQCVSQSNGGNGIAVTSSCQVAENNCNSNGSGGLLTAGAGNRVEGNSSNQNKFGFLVNGTANLVVRNNACSNTVADYSVSAGNNYGQILNSPGPAFASSNAWANFGCGSQPQAVCGDGIVQAGETCDDGNTNNGDGCGETCQVEAGICGNGLLEAGEQCDGGNLNGQTCAGLGYTSGSLTCNGNCTYNSSGCSNMTNAICGDGIVQAGESCDDGNTTNGDGCSAVCSVQSGFTCIGSPSVCTSVCGDGLVAAGESCDDGNASNGDGCSAVCSVESGFNCAGSPSVCAPVCGDGLVAAGESCDDGNASNGDGCSAVCSVESGFNCAGSPSVCTTINYSLITNKAGTGSGMVSSTPAGINCGADCSEAYSSGTVVSLSAASGVGSSFAGWSGGGCSGTGSCVVTMNAAKTVSATFSLSTYSLTVSKAGTGVGTVTSSPAGISCGATCSNSYSHGTSVTLTAAPQAGSSFAGWSGACTGTGSCVVSMTSAKSVSATFATP